MLVGGDLAADDNEGCAGCKFSNNLDLLALARTSGSVQ